MDAAGERRRRGQAGRRVRAARRRRLVAVERRATASSTRRVHGRGARRARVRGAVRRPAGAGGRRPPRDPVGRGRARRGHRDRPHRAGRGRRGLRALARARPAGARRRSTSPAASCPGYGDFEGLLDRRGRRAGHRGAATSAACSSRPARSSTATRSAGAARRRSSSASSTTGSSRATRSASRCSTPTRPSSGRRRLLLEADGRLAAQHGRLEHLAASATSGCRCRSTRATCGAAERDRLARGAARSARPAGSTSCRSCTGPGSTRCRSAARRAARRCAGSPRSATPGSTPASSRSRRSAGRTPSGSSTATRPARPQGLTGADLPDHAYWEKWFPADWVSEMREQIRLWFYSHLVHVDDARRAARPYRAVLTYEKLLDEHGPRDAQVVGERDRGGRGARAHGRRRHALACSARRPPSQNINFGYGPARRGQAPAADALELGQLLRRPTRTSPAGEPAWGAEPSSSSRSTAGSSRAPRSSSPRRRTPTSATGRPR